MENQKSFFRITTIYFIAMFCFVLLRIAVGLGAFSALDELGSSIIPTVVIQVGIMFLIPFILYITFYKKQRINKKNILNSFKEIGYKKISLKIILLTMCLGLIAYVFNIMIANIFDYFISLLGYESATSASGVVSEYSNLKLVIELIFTCVFPALFEETLHRGILFTGAKKIGYKKAILISGICFGLMHLNVNQFFYATILGMFMAFMCLVTKNIWVPIIIHFMNNALNVYMAYAEANSKLFGNFFEKLNSFTQNNNFFVVVICVISVVLLLTILGIVIAKEIYNHYNKDNKISFRFVNNNLLNRYIKDNSCKIKKVCERNNSTNNINPVGMQNLVKIESNKQLTNEDNLLSNSSDQLPMLDDIKIQDILEKNNNIHVEFRYAYMFYATLILGGLTTFFTFIWGVI